MKQAWVVALREMRMGFRNPWAYTYILIFALFMMTLLMIHAQGYVQGYSSTTATTLNLVLYLLPLITLMLGSFSLTGEKEEGSWDLLASYPLSTVSYLTGKYGGLMIVLLVIIALGFGAAGVLGFFAGTGFRGETYAALFAFAASIALTFLALAMLAGSLAANRWQALAFSVAIWFFLVIAWTPILIALLGFLPYAWIKPAVTLLTLLNPAELARLFTVVHLGGGSVLGPEYYDWVQWIREPAGVLMYAVFLIVWIGVILGIAHLLWERGRGRG